MSHWNGRTSLRLSGSMTAFSRRNCEEQSKMDHYLLILKAVGLDFVKPTKKGGGASLLTLLFLNKYFIYIPDINVGKAGSKSAGSLET